MKTKTKKWKARAVIFTAVAVYLFLAIAPFWHHKEAETEFKPEQCYGNNLSKERVASINENSDGIIYRLWMLEEAKEEICLSTYDFNADESGKTMMSALLQAAERGVRVRIVVDGITGLLDVQKGPYFKALVSHENISFKIYNPINLWKPWKLQARLHDKYLIVDRNMYLLGGRNTTNLFLGNYSKKQNIDRELFVYAPKKEENLSAKQLFTYFESIWESVDCKEFLHTERNQKVSEAYTELFSIEEEIQALYPEMATIPDWRALTLPARKITLLTNPIETKNKEPKLWHDLYQLMRSGNEVIIHTPYIICGKEMYEDLTKLCEQTNQVDIIINDVASGANPWGCTDYLNQQKNILKTGVRIYEFMGDYSSHTKTILIDDRISIVGSYNLDMRSTYLNTELMLVVDSLELNELLKREAKNDKTYSKSIVEGEKYRFGEHYREQEFSPIKKIVYFFLRIVIVPIRRLL